MENDLVTSKEIIRKTNISRATLNNYIRYGILPRPLVRTPQQKGEGPTKIGCFPKWVIERVHDVQTMKREGKTMEEIVRIFSNRLVEDTGNAEKFDLYEKWQHSNRGNVPGQLKALKKPSFLSVCVLAADLENSAKIGAELPPVEYFELNNRLWRDMNEIFDSYSALRCMRESSGMLYCFVEKPGVDYILNALKCALEVVEKVRIISSEWQLKKGWLNELYVNMGLDEGMAHLGTIQTSHNPEIAALGDPITRAVRLSSMARHGAVYATKNLINMLDEEKQRSIAYGIRRQHPERGEVFIERSFSRAFDLLHSGAVNSDQFMGIGMYAVTEIVSMK